MSTTSGHSNSGDKPHRRRGPRQLTLRYSSLGGKEHQAVGWDQPINDPSSASIKLPLYNGLATFFLKIFPSCGGTGPHLTLRLFRPTRVIPHTASRSVQPFLQVYPTQVSGQTHTQTTERCNMCSNRPQQHGACDAVYIRKLTV